MTEAEAKQRWCPFAASRVDWKGRAAMLNEAADDSPVLLCLASGCMAWRWDYRHTTARIGEPTMPVSGYCGLAGAP